MNGPQHYAAAARLVAEAQEDLDTGRRPGQVAARASLAQVHATLALVAATIDAGNGTEFRGAQDYTAHEVAYSPEWSEVTR